MPVCEDVDNNFKVLKKVVTNQSAGQLFLLITFIVCRVFFRGILRSLVPVYQGIMDLLHEVVQCRPMAFLTDITLPGDLAAFLGPSYSDLLKERSTPEPFKMKKTKKTLLDKLFEEGSEEKDDDDDDDDNDSQVMQMLASEKMTSNIDLGRAVLRQGPPCSRMSDFIYLFVCFLNELSK